MRVAKVMARAGLCSRRDAEIWITEGRVTLNGKLLTTPAINVGPQDQISVDGVALAERERTRLFLFHKPRGLVTTDKDPEGRQTIFDYLHQNWPDGPRVISIGRLDINTEGLLLLTNDGGLARVLELPSTGWMRRYRVRANGKTDQAILDRLRDGLTVDGVDYAGIEATLDRVQGDNVWLSLGLREGKNREIKRVLEHIGLYVNRLIRISYGPFQLGELAEGKIEEVRTRVLRDQLGPTLANEANADFESPLAEPPREEAAPRARGRTPREPGHDQKSPRSVPRPHSAGPRERDTKLRRPREDTRETGRDRTSAPPRSGGPRERDGKSTKREAPAPVEPSFKPRGPRKHISAMRATSGEPAQGERKKSFLSETADRKGRAVVVERKAKVGPRTRREDPARDNNEKRERRAPVREQDKRPARASARVEESSARPARPARLFKDHDAAKPTRGPRDGKPSTHSKSSTRPESVKPERRERPARAFAGEGKNDAGVARSKTAGSRTVAAKTSASKNARPPRSERPQSAPPKGGRPVKPGRPQRTR